MTKNDKITKDWTEAFQFLVGSKIIKVDYMSSSDADKCGWHNRPIQIHLDNEAVLTPQMDDEGNNGGALWVGLEVEGEDRSLAPVLEVE